MIRLKPASFCQLLSALQPVPPDVVYSPIIAPGSPCMLHIWSVAAMLPHRRRKSINEVVERKTGRFRTTGRPCPSTLPGSSAAPPASSRRRPPSAGSSPVRAPAITSLARQRSCSAPASYSVEQASVCQKAPMPSACRLVFLHSGMQLCGRCSSTTTSSLNQAYTVTQVGNQAKFGV